MDQYIRSTFDKGCESYDSYTVIAFSNIKERRAWQKLYKDVLKGHGNKVLNVGCGPGTEALTLADIGFDVTALDFSENMIEATRRNAERFGLKLKTVQGDAENLPFDNDTFDVIISNYALWAIPNPQKAMEEWFRVLSSNGIVAFIDGVWNTRNYSWWRKKWVKVAIRMRNKDNNGHPEQFTDEEKDHLSQLWSKHSERPETDLGMMERAGFSNITLINKVDRRIFKGRRYIEYGYHKIHYMITGIKK